jgi:hypothetical protein
MKENISEELRKQPIRRARHNFGKAEKMIGEVRSIMREVTNDFEKGIIGSAKASGLVTLIIDPNEEIERGCIYLHPMERSMFRVIRKWGGLVLDRPCKKGKILIFPLLTKKMKSEKPGRIVIEMLAGKETFEFAKHGSLYSIATATTKP